MAQNVGTHDISDLLAARFASAAAYGLNTIEKVLLADIEAHNRIVQDLIGNMCEMSTDRQRIYGTSAAGDLIEVDEYGLAPTQRSQPGATVAFPMKLFQFNLGWTYKWLQIHTPADMATMVLAAEAAHWRKIQAEVKRAVFLSANYTFLDHLVDNVSLGVKRFLNADSSPIPNGPNGETFTPASHTHYVASATFTAAAWLASVNNVIEHGFGGHVITAINKADETAARALTGFVAYQDPRIILPVYSSTGYANGTLDISRLDNRAIGIFNGAEVWVKSWCPQYYTFTWDEADPNKPLVFRQRSSAGLTGLNVAAENGDYPLFAKDMEAEFGIGVWTRTNGACGYYNNATWADPSITG